MFLVSYVYLHGYVMLTHLPISCIYYRDFLPRLMKKMPSKYFGINKPRATWKYKWFCEFKWWALDDGEAFFPKYFCLSSRNFLILLMYTVELFYTQALCIQELQSGSKREKTEVNFSCWLKHRCEREYVAIMWVHRKRFDTTQYRNTPEIHRNPMIKSHLAKEWQLMPGERSYFKFVRSILYQRQCI